MSLDPEEVYINTPVELKEEEEKENKSIFTLKFLNKIIHDLGGIAIAGKSLSYIFKIINKFNKNEKVSKILTYGEEFVPAFITAYKLIDSIASQIKKKDASVNEDHYDQIRKLVDCSSNEGLNQDEFIMGREIIQWLVSKPITKKFKIVGFYDTDFQKVNNIDLNKDGSYYISIIDESSSKKFLFFFNYIVMIKDIYIRNSIMWFPQNAYYLLNSLHSTIFNEFINTFTEKNSIIHYTAHGLITKKKEDNEFNINQIDVKSLIEQISASIKMNKKRCIVLSGRGGTGKTTIISQIEKELTNIPIIHLYPNTLNYEEEIITFFNFARSIKPCLLVFEDFDAFQGLERKNDRTLGYFLDNMDSSKEENNGIIIIATVNDTSLINGTLINRRGRFDKVIYVDGPRTKKEVYDVLVSICKGEIYKNKEFEKYIDFNEKTICAKFYKTVLNYRFTHADIKEIINNIVIMDRAINNKNLMNSLNDLIDTKKAIERSYKEKT